MAGFKINAINFYQEYRGSHTSKLWKSETQQTKTDRQSHKRNFDKASSGKASTETRATSHTAIVKQ